MDNPEFDNEEYTSKEIAQAAAREVLPGNAGYGYEQRIVIYHFLVQKLPSMMEPGFVYLFVPIEHQYGNTLHQILTMLPQLHPGMQTECFPSTYKEKFGHPQPEEERLLIPIDDIHFHISWDDDVCPRFEWESDIVQLTNSNSTDTDIPAIFGEFLDTLDMEGLDDDALTPPKDS